MRILRRHARGLTSANSDCDSWSTEAQQISRHRRGGHDCQGECWDLYLRRGGGDPSEKLTGHGEALPAFRADIAARLAKVPPGTRSLSARLLGDPLPGRSALDKRNSK